MTVDRPLFLRQATDKRIPPYVCSACGRGVLQLLGESTFDLETTESQRNRRCEGWEPEFIRMCLSGIVKCSHPECGETAIIGGELRVEEAGDAYVDDEPSYYHSLKIQVLMPGPALIVPHDDLPKVVRKRVQRAFDLFFSDTAASLNALRSAIELLLDDLGVAREDAQGKKIRRMTLHERLDIHFRKMNEEVADLLLAVKWIANEPSHGGDIPIDGVFDAWDVFELAVSKLLDAESSAKILKMAGEVNKNRGLPQPDTDPPF